MIKVGEIKIKGLAVDDIVTILGNNGYATEVFTPFNSGKVIHEWEHVVRIYNPSLYGGGEING